MDAGVQHRRGRAPRRDLRGGAQRRDRRGAGRRRAAGRGGARRGLDGRGPVHRRRAWSAGPTSGPFELVDWPGAPTATSCVLADYVTTEDGTGLVHQAPAFGADDLAVGRAYGLPVVNPVRPDGHFDADVPLVGGVFFKDADKALVERPRRARPAVPAPGLRAHLPALLALPHGAALLRASRPGTSARPQVKDALLAENERTNWFPDNIKWGRYGDWLHNNIDWALSRSPLLGHAAADLALRRRTTRTWLRRVAGRARRAGRAATCPTLDPHRPVRRRRRRCPAPRAAARARCAGCPRSSTPGTTPARCRSPSGATRTRPGRTRSSSRPSRRSSSARRSTRPAAGSTR